MTFGFEMESLSICSFCQTFTNSIRLQSEVSERDLSFRSLFKRLGTDRGVCGGETLFLTKLEKNEWRNSFVEVWWTSLILPKGFWRVIVTRLSVSFSFALSNSVNNGYEVAILEICLCDVTFRQGIDLVADSTVRNEQLSFDVDPRVGLFKLCSDSFQNGAQVSFSFLFFWNSFKNSSLLMSTWRVWRKYWNYQTGLDALISIESCCLCGVQECHHE